MIQVKKKEQALAIIEKMLTFSTINQEFYELSLELSEIFFIPYFFNDNPTELQKIQSQLATSICSIAKHSYNADNEIMFNKVISILKELQLSLNLQ